MAIFAIPNSSFGTQQAMTTTYKTICAAAASTASNATVPGQLRRGLIFDILVGTNATPADNYVEYALTRATIGASLVWTGSLSSVSSAVAINPADGPVSGGLIVNASAETNVAKSINVWYVGVNQRASYRWVAAPGSEFIYPAVSSGSTNGLALCAQSGAYTGTVTGTILLSEM